MKYIYGPVPSRRLGFSLGVDMVPYKTCTLDCIYCQLGKTTCKTVERRPYARKADILDEIKEVFRRKQKIDYITFSGSGEPTLNAEIGDLIREVKRISPVPLVVLTNGTLLFMKDVQNDLREADIVMPSLDAASVGMFHRINRPHDELNVDSIVQGLKEFREMYNGRIWLEVMLIKNFNDSPEELARIKDAISGIQPERVYLNTVVRPPSEMYAKPLNSDEMAMIRNYLDKNCEVIAAFHGQKIEEVQDVEEAAVEMTRRRPVTVADIAGVLGVSEANARTLVKTLKDSGKLKETKYKGAKYYSYAAESRGSFLCRETKQENV